MLYGRFISSYIRFAFLFVSRLAINFFFIYFFFYGYGYHRDLHSFPTRRSSDLGGIAEEELVNLAGERHTAKHRPAGAGRTDRKSTRLNSSHTVISYAVFCLKKKIKNPGCGKQ